MTQIHKLDAYTRAAHRLASLPDGWEAHAVKLAPEQNGASGRALTGAVFKPYKIGSYDRRPSWSRRIAGTAQTLFVADAAFNQAMSELRAEAKAKRDAKFPFMFVIVDDEADAAGFLNHTILPDYFARDRMVSEKQVWRLIQQWGGNKVKTARIQRIISAALDTWNSRAGELAAQERKVAREAMA